MIDVSCIILSNLNDLFVKERLIPSILDNSKLERDLDFVGATVPNVYVFGNGMYYCEYYRNVNGVYAIKKI